MRPAVAAYRRAGPPAGGAGGRGLSGRAVAGLGWVLRNAAAGRRGMLATGVAAGWLMTPAQAGALAAAVMVLLVFRSIGDLGASRALQRWRGEPRQIAPTVMTMSLAAGAVLAAVCYLSAPAAASLAGAPAAAPVIRVLALDIVLAGAVATPAALLERHPRGVRKAIADQAGNWTGVAVTIWLAAAGTGAMSAGAGLVAGGAVRAAALLTFAPTALRPGFRWAHARATAHAGITLAGCSMAMFAVVNVDQLVVGHVLHQAALGFYLLAFSLASWPVAVASGPVRRAAPAAFARLRCGPRLMGSAYLSAAGLLASVTVPVSLLISAVASPLIQIMYGPAWAPAAHALVWLAPLAALRVMYELTSGYVAELGSGRALLVFHLIWLTALVPPVAVWAWARGIAGAALVQVPVAMVLLVPWYLMELKRLRIRPRGPVAWLGLPLAAGLAVGMVALWVRRTVPDERAGIAAGGLASMVAIGVLLYRMRGLVTAVRRAAVSAASLAHAAAMSPSLASAAAPALAAVLEPPLYPVRLPVPAAPRDQGPAAPAQPGGPGTQQAGLGRRVRAGARWSLVNTAVLRVANFLLGVVLARTVFGPHAWGLYAVSQVVLAILLSANEMGVSLAIVRWDGDVRSFARTVLTLSVGFSAAFYGLLFVTAPWVASLLGSPGATSMLRVLCVCVIIDGFACVPLGLLTREFAQGRRMLADSANFAVSTGVTLWLALTGHGAISFAWGSVAGNVVALAAATVAAPYIVVPGWNTGEARRLLRFGLPLAGASLLVLAILNVDSAIVGATLGPAALGLYQLAFNVSSWPVRSVSEAARRVSFAGFSRLAGSREMLSDGFTRAAGLLMVLAVPACAFLITLAQPLIRDVYGLRWVPAAPALSLLAMLGLMRVGYELAYDCLAAAGRRHLLLGVQGLWLAVLVPALLAGAWTRGITGVAAGHAAVAGILVGPAFGWALARAGVTMRALAARCGRPVIGGCLMAAASLAVGHFAGTSPAGLAAAIAAGWAVYVPVVLPMRALIRQSLPIATEVTEARAA